MLQECLLALWRRRALSIVGLLIAVTAANLVFLVVKPVQERKAEVLFVPSAKQPGVQEPTNPLLNLGGSVAVVAQVVQTQVVDDRTVLALRAKGLTADFTVEPNLAENAGPMLEVTTSDSSSATARATLKALLGLISDDLVRLQLDQGAKKDLLVRSVVLTTSPKSIVVHKTQVKLAIVAFLAALGLCAAAILLYERRRILAGLRGRQPADPTSVGQPPMTSRLSAERPDELVRRSTVTTSPSRRP